jgi:stage V sporulation protein B
LPRKIANVVAQTDAAQVSPADVVKLPNKAGATGKGGLALSFAKLYFMVLGLVQQIALSWLLQDAYGALRGALSPASIVYNAAVTASVLGMSRVVSQTTGTDTPSAVRQALGLHTVLGVLLGTVFWVCAHPLGWLLQSPHLIPLFQWLSVVVGVYSVYAALVGVLNGQRRFVAQAALDVLSATLRTGALCAGAYLFAARGADAAVSGAIQAFAVMAALMVVIACFVAGAGRAGRSGYSLTGHLRFVLPVMGGQLLLNLLLQADTNTLRAFAARAAQHAGLPVQEADTFVGAYNAGQLWAFLPYQLLTALTFLLFPLLAQAAAARESDKVRAVVTHGCRLAILLVGLGVCVSLSIPGPLLHLVFPPKLAALGTESMQVLAVGMGALALFGVFCTVLNSLDRQWVVLAITLLGLSLVVASNFAWVSQEGFSPRLLTRTAWATSGSVILVSVIAGIAVYRATGTGVRLLTVVRVVGAVLCCYLVGRAFPELSRLATLVVAALLVVGYLTLLLVTREIGAADVVQLRLLFGRGAPPSKT